MQVEQVLAALADFRCAVETDWRPNRVELASPGHGWVDVHPLETAAVGSVSQAALGGARHELRDVDLWMSTRSIDSVAVRCAGDEPVTEHPG